jgi:DivIVA domain-containing protein
MSMSVMNEHTRTKRFSTVRLRDGYDMGEVDQFIEELEQSSKSLESQKGVLEQANLILRSELAAATARIQALEEEQGRAPAPAEPIVQAAPDAAVTASRSATRLLEMAARDAETLMVEARDEAEQTLAGARAQAEETVATARAEAEQLTWASMVEAQAREEALEARLAEIGAEVDRLVDFERGSRTELVSFFTRQLEALGDPVMGRSADAHGSAGE